MMVGWGLVAAGLIGMLFGAFAPKSEPFSSVINLGMLGDKLISAMIGGFLFLAGVALLASRKAPIPSQEIGQAPVTEIRHSTKPSGPEFDRAKSMLEIAAQQGATEETRGEARSLLSDIESGEFTQDDVKYVLKNEGRFRPPAQ